MRKYLILYISSLMVLTLCFMSGEAKAMPPVKWNQRYQTYIDTYRDVAIYEMLQHGIPASITMAQGLLESGAGFSTLSTKGNNHFGIKCHDWTGPSMNKDDDALGECFRVYNSAFESYEDHSKFLKRSRYSRLFSLKRTDYKGWAHGLKACGYATNPRYAYLLIDIIECYNLNSLDRETAYNKKNLQRLMNGMSLPLNANDMAQGNSANIPVYAHDVKMCNRNYYVVARRGDTFKSIAKEFGLSYRRIAKYNERDKKDVLRDGDIIYLEKKRTKADKAYKHNPHIVKPGESMYSIAQKYGVRLKSLYKKNKLDPDYSIRVNDVIEVY